MQRTLLLGGAPAIGKSHVARRLADRLGVPCTSTDTIRSEMRRSTAKAELPDLFLLDDSTIGTPLNYLSATPVSLILSDVHRECRAVWTGVVAVLRNPARAAAQIIEGCAILPEEATAFIKDERHLSVAVLVNSDTDMIASIINSRGLGGPAELFPPSVRRKQLDWVCASNEQYRAAAKRVGVPVIDLADGRHLERLTAFAT